MYPYLMRSYCKYGILKLHIGDECTSLQDHDLITVQVDYNQKDDKYPNSHPLRS